MVDCRLAGDERVGDVGDTIAETKNMTYYLSTGSLFSVDKQTNEVRALNISNDLNGGAIKGIYPHPEGKYLIVAYQDWQLGFHAEAY